ncbi:MAG: hypothetical protein HFP81_05735 [Methylococcales symbiont of Hymedesmia sp. n. MRB-2018]|nr:MAG: hypothetical protein HFP81_05735 [Methylococcales symbiont of Hymedesmia sp. n. MRB-2018]
MKTNKYQITAFLISLSLYSQFLNANQDILNTPLFQNKFFTLSTDHSLICETSKAAYISTEELLETIYYYEKYNPKELRKFAVAVLTDHAAEEHQEDLHDYREDCKKSIALELCVLEKYWDDNETALRALALFYDTKTIVKHSESYQTRRFSKDHLRVFEKAIRKIPPFMRKKISQAKPIRHLEKEIKNLDSKIQLLIQDAFPEDFATSIWSDDTHPLTFVPGKGFNSQVVAQVYNGQNLIIFTVKAFDKGKDGRLYRDIDLKYLVDFRIPIIVHEIAHTIDNFHFWNGEDALYYFYRYRKISTDNETVKMIIDSKLALWPSKWFEAFEYLWEVNDGRYDGQIQEKLAELVAQYILIPERLKKSAPKSYQWLHNDVFKTIEYRGYDTCTQPIIKTLNWWEYSIAKMLGD